MHLDTTLFSAIYGLSHQSTVLDAVAVFFAKYLAYLWGGAIVLAIVWPHAARARTHTVAAVAIAAGVIARFGVKELIVLAYGRPRPFVVLPDVHPLISSPISENFQSFPSGHVIFFFAISSALFCFDKKLGTIAFIAAALMGLARVYVGVHWPSDILAGAILGTLTGWITYRLYLKYKNRTLGSVTV